MTATHPLIHTRMMKITSVLFFEGKMWKSTGSFTSRAKNGSFRRALSSRTVNGLVATDLPGVQPHVGDESSSAMVSKIRKMVRGKVLDHSIDLRRVRPGDRVDIPYQITVSETMQDFWFAAFFDQNR